MLDPLDETLMHQVALPFSRTTISDHRFYDRVFLTAFDPEGSASVMMGMGLYKNMNVIDAFSCVVRDNQQYNVRASRPLRPNTNTEVGPIHYEIIQPFRELRFRVDLNESGVALDLVWTSSIDPFLEGDWQGNNWIINERIAYDTQRYDQLGRWNGWIEVAGERLEVNNWCAGRDHSWGVRNGVGGYEPVNGPSEIAKGAGFFLGFFVFTNGLDMAGYAMWTENERGRFKSMDGALRWKGKQPDGDLEMVDLDHDILFSPDTRHFDGGTLKLHLEDSSTCEIAFSKPMPGTILKGYGGHGEGFKDGKGFGVYRGELVEHDVYDLDDPAMKQLPVEQPILVSVDGKPGGYGWATVLATGELSRFRLKRQSVDELKRYGIAVDNLEKE